MNSLHVKGIYPHRTTNNAITILYELLGDESNCFFRQINRNVFFFNFSFQCFFQFIESKNVQFFDRKKRFSFLLKFISKITVNVCFFIHMVSIYSLTTRTPASHNTGKNVVACVNERKWLQFRTNLPTAHIRILF